MPIKNMPITSNTSVNDLFAFAQEEIKNLFPGENFVLKSLYTGYEWDRIDKGNRTRLGSAFFTFAQGQGSALLECLKKTAQNQQLYRRK